MTDTISPKTPNIFVCEHCDYTTKYRNDFKKHCSTRKHSILTGYLPKSPNTIKLVCECGHEYKHRQSLFNHRKICQIAIEYMQMQTQQMQQTQPQPQNINTDLQMDGNPSATITTDIVLQILKQNEELQKMLIEQTAKFMEIAKDGKYINNSNNTTNNTTNNFNLNLFLNEKCKDAINITDFVNSLVVNINDLEETARLGYAEGISKIFINGLKQLDIYKRPIHCSDLKREVLYIKDQDNWSKDDDKTHLIQAIKVVGNKNIKQISEWQKVNPHFRDPESKQNDQYLSMLCNVMSGGSKEETTKNYDKIVRNIVKETVIDK
jgi:hypothetical protein